MHKLHLVCKGLLVVWVLSLQGCKITSFDSMVKSEGTPSGYQADFMCNTIPEFNLVDEFKLPKGETQRSLLCARPNRNKVTSVFCDANAPTISSLKDLQQALGLNVSQSGSSQGLFGFGGLFGGAFNRGAQFAFTAASSSLVGRFTSEINPRLLMFSTPRANDPNMVALGFVRGEQFVELVARDANTSALNFYLVKFSQSCNKRSDGCNKGELLGPDIEKNWQEVTLYQDSDVENTILDCTQCHQPGGVGTQKILRMQELRNPWTHFLSATTNGGRQLLSDFQRAHPNSEFAGIPANMISRSQPAQLEQFVRQNGFGNQPNEFPSAQIEGGGLGGLFGIFSARGSNARDVWSPLYERSVKGEMIAPPFYKLKVSDPDKIAQMTQAYLDLSQNRITKAEFPDTRNIHPNQDLRDLQYMVKEGLSGQEILTQACSQCHNSQLNQNISRAKFNVDLTKMPAAEIDLAIKRMNLACDDPLKMPPVRFRTLTNDEIQRVSQYLQKVRPVGPPTLESDSPRVPGADRNPPSDTSTNNPPTEPVLNFAQDINPILVKSCSGTTCHSDGNFRPNSVYVDREDQFRGADSERIASGSMPPEGADKSLSQKDRATLLRFLQQ